MTRRRALDWALIVLLTLSWGVLFGRGVSEGLRTQRGKLQVGVSSAPSAEAYPTVKPSLWRPGQVTSGDEVTAVDGRDLRGFSALRFYDLATRAARERGLTEIALSRSGSPFTLGLTLEPRPLWWLGSVYSLLLMATGLFLLVRVPDWHLAQRYLAAAWCFAIPPVVFDGFGPAGLASEVTLTFLCYASGCALTIWNAQDFTLAARPVPRLHRTFALPSAILFAAAYLNRYWLSYGRTLSDLAAAVAVAALAAATIAGLARAYARSEPLERRQIRWLVLGYYVAVVGALFATLIGLEVVQSVAGIPNGSVLGRALLAITGMAIPLGLMVSVIGYRWLDIDRLIAAVASYTIVGVAVLGGAVALVPRMAAAAAPALGVEPALAQWLLTMGLVLAAVPAHLYLRPRIDRGLFAERHRRVSGLAQLVDEVGRCSGADELWALTSERIDALLGPESLVAYAREGKVFAPRFARGAANPPPYDADSLIVRALERRGMPLAADASELDPFDRAALETLGVALVMPIGTHESLLGFACLGRKGSGDIYTREETAQLAAVALRCAQILRPDAERPPTLPNVFRREGELWTLASNGKEIRLRDMRGLHYLAALVREPGREFAATDLVSAASGLAPLAGVRDPDLQIARGTGDAGPILDAQARAAYRARLSELDLELADAERCADLGRSERASDERELLLAELESAGRGKRAASDSERARVAVTKAIKFALEKISERHPELGAHLATHVRRGYACAYDPDPRDAMAWEV